MKLEQNGKLQTHIAINVLPGKMCQNTKEQHYLKFTSLVPS